MGISAEALGALATTLDAIGVGGALLDQAWSSLSGGQSQRLYLGIMVAIRPQVLLLDEATSALDPETALLVEKLVPGCGAASVWITHSQEQAERVGVYRVNFMPDAVV